MRGKEFYNDAINELVDFTEDFSRWKDTQRSSFSFCAHPFVLDPGTKSKLLQLDANNQMRSQIRGALFRSIFGGNECPYLILRVRRDNLIRDTLLQISALHSQQEDLKKPLKVIFKGEEGIDEGGVQKEFFQLIVRQMFDLNYGMFTCDEESRCFWFSATALENAREFNLIGKVFGLAIYNSVILDVHFPMVCTHTHTHAHTHTHTHTHTRARTHTHSGGILDEHFGMVEHTDTTHWPKWGVQDWGACSKKTLKEHTQRRH